MIFSVKLDKLKQINGPFYLKTKGKRRGTKLEAEWWSQANFTNEKRQSESHLEPKVSEARLWWKTQQNGTHYFSGR